MIKTGNLNKKEKKNQDFFHNFCNLEKMLPEKIKFLF